MEVYNHRLMGKIRDYYGDKVEVLKACEELGELQHELFKLHDGKGDIDHLAEEIADVYIMLEHIKNIFSIPESKVQNIIRHKLDREENRIEKEKERENAKRIYV